MHLGGDFGVAALSSPPTCDRRTVGDRVLVAHWREICDEVLIPHLAEGRAGLDRKYFLWFQVRKLLDLRYPSLLAWERTGPGLMPHSSAGSGHSHFASYVLMSGFTWGAAVRQLFRVHDLYLLQIRLDI
jgi:hypothetical protein